MATNPFTVIGGEGGKRGPGRPPVGNERDPITIRDYDRATHYTRSSDGNGHRVALRVNYPQDWEWMVAKVVNAIPEYNSPSDLVRDALFHQLKYLYNNAVVDDRAAEELERQAATHAAEAHRVQVGQWMTHLEEAEEALRKFAMLRYGAGITEEVDSLRDWATRVPEPFRSRALALVAQYGTEPLT